MTGLDTNVLVRYITQDEPKQAAAASRAINRAGGAETSLTFDKALRDSTHFSIVRAAWHRKGR